MQTVYTALNPLIETQSQPTTEDSNLMTTGNGSNKRIFDKYAGSAAIGHRLLIQPNPYNILIGYQPTKDFLQKLESQIPG